VNGAHQFRRVVEPPPIARLAKPDADWCEVHEDQVAEGAHGRDQRDEQDALENDFWHTVMIREYETATSGFQTAQVLADRLNRGVAMA
jgi:hypothetical protein